MHHRSFLMRLWAALVMSFGLVGAATAQPVSTSRDDGDYQILQALYGTARSNIDVTPRLRELARSDRGVRIGNDTFGADPDPGQRKTLRLYARGRDGQTRAFDYPEGGTVDGAQFVGWNRGNFGDNNFRGGWHGATPQVQAPPQVPTTGPSDGEYTILQAVYGTQRNNTDVTPRLRELASQGRGFRVTSAVMGVDPEPGEHKVLIIHAQRRDGQRSVFEYPENGVFDGSQFAGWSRGVIGESGNRGEPGVRDGDRDRRGGGRDEGEYRILQALYGTARRNVDVTDQLSQLARSDAEMRVSRSAFKVDPDPGRPKALRIYARSRDDQVRLFEFPQGSVIDGSHFRGWRAGQWGGREGYRGNWNGEVRAAAPASDLRIVSATWGSGSRKRDVTERLRSQVHNGRIEAVVDANLTGSDPAPGARKTLWVTYAVDGRTQQARVDENGHLSIP